MTIHELVLIAIGEIVLAATFALGIFVGLALKRKEARHDDDN
jgi:hypothetical protein